MKKLRIFPSISALCSHLMHKKKKTYQLAHYCDLELHESLYFSMHFRDVLKYNAYIHTCTVRSFNRLFGNLMI